MKIEEYKTQHAIFMERFEKAREAKKALREDLAERFANGYVSELTSVKPLLEELDRVCELYFSAGEKNDF